jgi:hypothetical protein
MVVKTKVAPVQTPFHQIKGFKKIQNAVKKRVVIASVPAINIQDTPQLLIDARKAMTAEDYRGVVRLTTKLLKSADGVIRKQSLELLGLARERKGQIAHAKAMYKEYLKLYPEGSDANRVKQRLAGLVTAKQAPKARLKDGTTDDKTKKVTAVKKSDWKHRVYGNISQIFFHDQTTPEGGTRQLNRSDLTTDVSLNGRSRNKEYDLRTQFTGGYRNDFIAANDDGDWISKASFEAKHKSSGLSGEFGRQSLSSSGVLGRFDGAQASYEVNDQVTLNGVFGYPVASSSNSYVNTDKMFYGASLDLGTYKEKWDFNTFVIQQDNQGLTDRRAVGGEVRYFKDGNSFFSLVDYDIEFNDLNIFLTNGNWKYSDKTTFNAVIDYRKSPLITLNNSIQGQGVSRLSDLFSTYTEDELISLAQDRSATSHSFTGGVTHKLREDIQLSGEMTMSEIDSTYASGGVDAAIGTGKEYFYSTQLITNNTFIDNDVIISSLRYSDTQNYNTYTALLDGRVPFGKKLRITPKVRVDYRTEKTSDDIKLTVRPVLRTSYRINRNARIESEIGAEFIDDESAGVTQSTTELFLIIGYRANF